MTNQEITVSSRFKRQAIQAVVAILFFVLVYLLILVASIVLTGLSIYGGVQLILVYPSVISFFFGAGLASMGVLVLVFLIKFMFKSNKVNYSHFIEMKKEDEPKLFALIEEVVTEVGTDFPKKVFLSADVNASVFYNSSFWSMIFPVKKNLQIGLGLVNSLTAEELKSVLGHEFGHFSQKSMKVGVYFYNLNQVMFNLLHDNEAYEELIQKWSNFSNILSLFVGLAVVMIQWVQQLLAKIFDVVNRSYMGLSREMEFHADQIAAKVTGVEPCSSSLLRLTLSDYAFTQVLSFYEQRISEARTSENIFEEHSFLLEFIGKNSELEFKNGFPQVTLEELNKFNKSKLVIKDQWASHPSTEDRIERLEKTGYTSSANNSSPASIVFSDYSKTQKEMTAVIFKDIEFGAEPAYLSLKDFQVEWEKDFRDNTFSSVFNNYYNNKGPLVFDLDSPDLNTSKTKVEDLFSETVLNNVYVAYALQNDMDVLQQIRDRQLPVKSFDYDGKKYKWKEANVLIPVLRADLNQINEVLLQNDKEIYSFFKQKEGLNGLTSSLDQCYTDLFEFESKQEGLLSLYTEMMTDLQFVQTVTPFEDITANFKKLEAKEEKLKSHLKEIIESGLCELDITPAIKENIDAYVDKPLSYFIMTEYNDANLNKLFQALNDFLYLLSRSHFRLKKNLLDYKESLLA